MLLAMSGRSSWAVGSAIPLHLGFDQPGRAWMTGSVGHAKDSPGARNSASWLVIVLFTLVAAHTDRRHIRASQADDVGVHFIETSSVLVAPCSIPVAP
jgi:hypothetical protein